MIEAIAYLIVGLIVAFVAAMFLAGVAIVIGMLAIPIVSLVKMFGKK